MERGDLAEFGKKNATQMMIFLPIENVARKKIYVLKLFNFFCDTRSIALTGAGI